MLSISGLVALALLVTPGFTGPVSVPRAHLVKRTNPTIGEGFTEKQVKQITDGFRDAIQLASYAIREIDSPASYGVQNYPVFTKYFREEDKDLVKKTFLAIMGNPADPKQPDVTGSAKLGGLSVVKDYPDDDGELACDGETMAELRDWETDNPKLVLCDAGLGHGGIGKGYDGAPAPVTCEFIGDRVNWRMDTIGSIFLHEYT